MIPRKTLTAYRTAAGSFLNGIYTPGVETSFSISASVQPASGKTLERLPEGRRLFETVVLFSSDLLYSLDDGTVSAPDQVLVNGKRFEVYSSEIWQNNVLPHYKYVVQRVKEK